MKRALKKELSRAKRWFRRDHVRHRGRHDRWRWIALGLFNDPAKMFSYLLKQRYAVSDIPEKLVYDDSPLLRMISR